MDTDRALEMARSAQINLENMARTAPIIKYNPFFVIASEQLTECIKVLEDTE